MTEYLRWPLWVGRTEKPLRRWHLSFEDFQGKSGELARQGASNIPVLRLTKSLAYWRSRRSLGGWSPGWLPVR